MNNLALITTLCLLGACSPAPTPDRTARIAPPLPEVAPVVGAASAASSADTSLPDAASVVAPAVATKPDPAAAGRTNTTMSRDQESSAMPLPGQNNDHSAPLPPARRASAP
jgi:hypothetical protein